MLGQWIGSKRFVVPVFGIVVAAELAAGIAYDALILLTARILPDRIFGNARREAPLSSQPCIESNFGRWT